ncbi:MAG TPA: erythromycin esterase family protein [Bryobacteraceae bacterium]|nr:erythromycin esterase family protein [Bryobacteraceae bacterium]
MSDAIKDALALLPSTVCACVAFVLSFGITGDLSFNLAAAVVGFALSMWFLVRHSRWRVAVTAVSTSCLLAAAIAPAALDRVREKPAPVSDDLVRQIGSASIPFQSVDAGTGFADLEPLRKIWQGTRIVALGEATHGTSEFFRMKHRLTEFLVTQMGFRHFAMEMDADSAAGIESYIQGHVSSNPVARLSWPGRTREVAAMVDWMRKYNGPVPEPDRIHFHGIDYQGQRRDFQMARNTLALLEEVGVGGRVILWAHNAHISSGAGWMGSYLKPALRNDIYLTGFEFHHGRFTSNLAWVRTYEAEPADSRFYASALMRIGRPILFLDFRTMMEIPAVETWLRQPKLSHDLQEAHGVLRLNPAWVRDDESWPSLYDGLIYIEESTPARPL